MRRGLFFVIVLVAVVAVGATATTPAAGALDAECDPLPDELNATAEFESQTTAYCETWETLERDLAAVENATAALNADNELDQDEAEQALTDLRETQHELHTIRSELEQEVYNLMVNFLHAAGDRERLVATMDGLEQDSEDVDSVVTETTTEYVEALEDAESDAESTIQTNLLLGLGGGFVVGLLAGAVLPWRKGSKASDFYQVSSQTSYDAGVLKLPWLLGVVLLVVGIVLLVQQGIAGVIV